MTAFILDLFCCRTGCRCRLRTVAPASTYCYCGDYAQNKNIVEAVINGIQQTNGAAGLNSEAELLHLSDVVVNKFAYLNYRRAEEGKT